MEKNKTDEKQYTCPMHPEIDSDKPGSCPECGMNLVENNSNKSAEHNHPTKQK